MKKYLLITLFVIFSLLNLQKVFAYSSSSEVYVSQTPEAELQSAQDKNCAQLIEEARHEENILNEVLECELGLDEEEALAALDTAFPFPNPGLTPGDDITNGDIPKSGFFDPDPKIGGDVNLTLRVCRAWLMIWLKKHINPSPLNNDSVTSFHGGPARRHPIFLNQGELSSRNTFSGALKVQTPGAVSSAVAPMSGELKPQALNTLKINK